MTLLADILSQKDLLSDVDIPSMSEQITESVDDSKDAPYMTDQEAKTQKAVNAVAMLFKDKPLKSESEEKAAKVLQSYLGQLQCLAWNRRYSDELKNQTSDLLSKVQTRLINYTKRKLIRDPETSLLCRYAIAGQYFPECNQTKLFEEIHKRGYLMKSVSDDGKVQFYLKGLACKVGDNVFMPDSMGREYRQYVRVTVEQAFAVNSPTGVQYKVDSAPFIASVPEFNPDEYHLTHFGDGKGAARRFPVQWQKAYLLLIKLGCI